MKKPKKTQINRKLFQAHALEQWGMTMSIPTKAIKKYTDCNHKIIFNGLFHRNRNIPNIRLLILNRTLNGQEDSDKEEHSWRCLPLWLQTTSQTCSNHHSEELAGTQTHGKNREPRNEPTCTWSVHENQTRNKRRGKDSLLKKQWQENWPPTRKDISVGHPLDHLTEIKQKTRLFAYGALSPTESWDGPLVSAQLDIGNIYFIVIFSSCSAALLVGTEATPLLSAGTQPHYPGAQALRKQNCCQLVTEPSLKAKHPAPVGQRGFWRPLRASREERAARCSQTSEGSPRSSSAVSTQTGNPNWNGAK